ncbi:hypothetical protein ASPFODRAFT_212786 [Aspergillus luchuensis CBS 106.47]|uniref:Uncharacterized protein n=1 Tax=Aspergillus luchuensis (strain CBS 106.47) TaxID=1137211 RepID=A0A1M3T0M3_ASPLC|nr:hypothetical protein ASPFODRAFT_212786 [Aspergillus luchuensis CBS 106.47]
MDLLCPIWHIWPTICDSISSIIKSPISYHHYFLKPVNDRLIHESIIELALQHGSLLYAVVGFSAYHHCVQNNSGKLYSFLKYYNIALKLLRKSLSSGELHNEATLITVLVLATFEKSIGNWVNLMCTIRLHKH